MSPKRRYQSSSFEFENGEHGAVNVNLSTVNSGFQNRPITPAEFAVNPCLTYKKIQPRPAAAPAAVRSDPILGRPQQSTSKGDRTYRVRHHHSTHFEAPPPPSQSFKTVGNSSLSQGIFGLPVIHDYLMMRKNQEEYYDEELGATVLLDSQAPVEGYQTTSRPVSPQQHLHLPSASLSLKEPCQQQRMKTTLPSFRTVLPPPITCPLGDENMDGVLQVRPASRRRTSEQRSFSSGAGGRTVRSRRVQSSTTLQAQRTTRSRTTATAGRRTALPTHTTDTNNNSSSNLDTSLRARRSLSSPPDNTESLLQECVAQLKLADTEWEGICSGFQQIQRLTENHPEEVKQLLKKIVWSGVPHLSSSRTKLSRAACRCFKRLYETQGRNMETEGDKVFVKLLDLSGGPCNKFIQEECKEALFAAVHHTDPLKCIHLVELRASKHKNRNVREFGACLLATVLNELPPEKIMNAEFAPKVIPLTVHFLKEGLLSTRMHAKECLERIIDHAEFQTKLERYVSPEDIRHVSDAIRKSSAGRRHNS